MSELSDLLGRVVPEPPVTVDVDAVATRVRHSRRRVVLVTGLAALLVLGGGTAVLASGGSAPRAEQLAVEASPTPSREPVSGDPITVEVVPPARVVAGVEARVAVTVRSRDYPTDLVFTSYGEGGGVTGSFDCVPDPQLHAGPATRHDVLTHTWDRPGDYRVTVTAASRCDADQDRGTGTALVHVEPAPSTEPSAADSPTPTPTPTASPTPDPTPTPSNDPGTLSLDVSLPDHLVAGEPFTLTTTATWSKYQPYLGNPYFDGVQDRRDPAFSCAGPQPGATPPPGRPGHETERASHTFDAPGEHTIRVSAYPACGDGPRATKTLQVHVDPAPSASPSPTATPPSGP